MARQVIKQPDGNYAIWSTIVDNFLEKNLSKKETKEFLLKDVMLDAESRVDKLFDDIDSGHVPSFYLTWDEANNFLEHKDGE
jgi:hypothetical protein